MSKDRRLGRGLAALLGTPLEEELAREPASTAAGPSQPQLISPSSYDAAYAPSAISTANGISTAHPPVAKSDTFQLNVYEIDDNPFQPRRDFSESEIASLAESLKEHDMLQPILVRRQGERYQLISGERRLRAAIRAGWSSVPARIREADDRLVAELAIVENLQRKDLNALEKALSFKRYLDEHKCTQDDLAQRLKIDRSTIANLVRLLELPATVQEAVRRGEVTPGHARALLPLGDEREQMAFAERIKTEGLSVREIERMVGEKIAELDGDIIKMPEAGPGKARRTKSDQIASLEQELRRVLGTPVEIRQGARGRGRIVVHFADSDEFERIFDCLVEPLPPRPTANVA